MSKKAYHLVTGILGGASTIAIAVVTFMGPSQAPAINAAIGIAVTAATEICALFIKKD